ncbi:MAG: hypothetical protein KDJ97_26015 [Anaerolineae bacterium]|nr:hypothetical protein [Anaerolineae bacterium]
MDVKVIELKTAFYKEKINCTRKIVEPKERNITIRLKPNPDTALFVEVGFATLGLLLGNHYMGSA